MFEKLLPRNEHAIERIARILLGAVGVSLVFVGPKTAWGYEGRELTTSLVGTPAGSRHGIPWSP